MEYPKIRVPASSREMVDVFGGYNHNLRIGDGEFYDMQNMTSDHYPVLSPREARGIYDADNVRSPAGLICKDALCYVDGSNFVINKQKIDMDLLTTADCDFCVHKSECISYRENAPVCQKQLISMGAYVVILPDRKWINTENMETGSIDATFVNEEKKISFSLCTLDGSAYDDNIAGETEPRDPENMQYWLDTSGQTHVLKQWSESAGMWVSVPTTYVKIECDGIGKYFEQYDGIHIAFLDAMKDPEGNTVYATDLAALEGAAVVWNKGDDYIVVVGVLDKERMLTSTVEIKRQMPQMDYVVESGNRLWGCRYGLSNTGEVVNEIYASKLGDFKNWNCYMGVSTDSYTASVGTDGQFTGAITHMGQPLFFKENCVHKVYGNYPANFQIQDTACNGVQKGSGKSLAIVNTTLFYKGRDGVYAYDGSLPVSVSSALGNVAYSGAVGGAIGNKYYISMADSGGSPHLFVLDTARNMWHREDGLQVNDFCACDGELYAISSDKILTMLGSAETVPEPVVWSVETGDLGISSPDTKYLSRLTVRMAIAPGAQVRIYAKYDSEDLWEFICCQTGRDLRSFSLPIRPRRCDHLRLRIDGVGMTRIYSITKTIEGGSELS